MSELIYPVENEVICALHSVVVNVIAEQSYEHILLRLWPNTRFRKLTETLVANGKFKNLYEPQGKNANYVVFATRYFGQFSVAIPKNRLSWP